MMAVASQRLTSLGYDDVQLVECGVERLPYPDQSFDVVTCIGLLMHLDVDVRDRALREFARVSRGPLIIQYGCVDACQRAIARLRGLPPGKVRVKAGGGVAGHNGLRSITAHVGNDYRRVRIGVGHPGDKDRVHAYVLNDFAKDERPWVEALCDIMADNTELLVKGQDASFQNKVHLAMQAKGFFDAKDTTD